MILYGNNTVTNGNRDKILNIGYDSTLTNSPINGTSGYQMQFTLGGAASGILDVTGKIRANSSTNATITLDGDDSTIKVGINDNIIIDAIDPGPAISGTPNGV